MAEAWATPQPSVGKIWFRVRRERKKTVRARVIGADDHPAVVKDLCAVLQREFDVVAAVESSAALLAMVDALSPDVIVTDITMPGLDGIAAASEIQRKNPAARIVFGHRPRRGGDDQEKLGYRSTRLRVETHGGRRSGTGHSRRVARGASHFAARRHALNIYY